MPWCPKCKLEYVEGITSCPDCGSALITDAEQTEKTLSPIFHGNEAVVERIVQFLNYSHIISAMTGEPTEKGYPVLVSKKESDEALKLIQVFLHEESEQAVSSDEDSKATDEHTQKAPGAYEKKADRYADTRSSGLTLLIIGIIGFIGMIPISIKFTSLLFDIVMFAMFVFFIVSGISALKRAKQLKAEISDEENTTQELIDWFLAKHTAESIDDAVLAKEEITEELYYFKRAEYMKEQLNTRLTEPDEAYLEDLTETLYQKLYDKE